MGWLTEAREGVKETLTPSDDTLNVWDYNPERIIVPAIAVTYGTPLLDDGTTFGDSLLRFVATLMPKVGTNESATDAMDKLIEDSVTALISAGYGVEQVGQPYMLQANNARYFAVDVQLTVEVQPEQE